MVHTMKTETATLAAHNARPELYDTGPAADYLGIKPHTLEVWRASGRYALPFVRVGRRIKYRRSDLDRFLEQNTVSV